MKELQEMLGERQAQAQLRLDLAREALDRELDCAVVHTQRQLAVRSYFTFVYLLFFLLNSHHRWIGGWCASA